MIRAGVRRRLRPANSSPILSSDGVSLFQLPGCTTLVRDPAYDDWRAAELFAEQYRDFQASLIGIVSSGLGCSMYKFGDGDYFFLTEQEVGSAKPGKRALKSAYADLDMPDFRRNAARCDYYTCELLSSNRDNFYKVFPDSVISWPAEYVYASVANRWLTRDLPGPVGLIGAAEKLEIVQRLLTHEEYQEYLGIQDFADYISIPQKFACDSADAVLKAVADQLEGASSRAFLVGVGHVKSYLLSELPKYHDALYLDVGSGIDALAGVVDSRRPYFGSWVNFRLSDSTLYEEVDFLQVPVLEHLRLLA